MRSVAALLLALAAPACVLTSGPDCADACEQVKECTGLDRTYRLACSTVGTNCLDFVAECAGCIEAHTCDELIAGACDYREDGSELCLVPPETP